MNSLGFSISLPQNGQIIGTSLSKLPPHWHLIFSNSSSLSVVQSSWPHLSQCSTSATAPGPSFHSNGLWHWGHSIIYMQPIVIQLKETIISFPSFGLVQIGWEALVGKRPPVFTLDGVEDGVVVFVFVRHNPTLVCLETWCAIGFVSVLVYKLGSSLYTHLQLLR